MPYADSATGMPSQPPFDLPVNDTVFVLASASSGRAGTLRRAGVEPLIQVSQVDEDAILASFPDVSSAMDAEAKVLALAEAKLADVVAGLTATQVVDFAAQQGMPLPRQVLVVGCDSMLEVAGELVGKPHTPQVAYQRIRQLSGAQVRLFTGHAMALLSLVTSDPPGAASFLGASGSLGTAGSAADAVPQGVSYSLTEVKRLSQCESTLIQFTELSDAEITAYIATEEPLFVAGSFTIDGLGGAFIRGVSGDPHSVVGISLPLLRDLAGKLGVFWPSVWNRLR